MKPFFCYILGCLVGLGIGLAVALIYLSLEMETKYIVIKESQIIEVTK